MQPYFGIAKMLFGKICPKATTTIKSGASSLNFSTFSASFNFTGWQTGISLATANSLTGEGKSFSPRPFFLSGCVKTAATLVISTSVFKLGTANSGVPMNTVFKRVIFSSPLFGVFWQYPQRAVLPSGPFRAVCTAPKAHAP